MDNLHQKLDQLIHQQLPGLRPAGPRSPAVQLQQPARFHNAGVDHQREGRRIRLPHFR